MRGKFCETRIPLPLLVAWMACAASLGVGILGCITRDLDSARRVARVMQFAQPAPVSVRRNPHNPLSDQLSLLGWGGPKPSERTRMFLRRYDLQQAYQQNADEAVRAVHALSQRMSNLESLRVAAELAYIQGEKQRRSGNPDRALTWYTRAIADSYNYLFDPRYDTQRNAYDPEFRQVCDLYNMSLEGLLRILEKKGQLQAGQLQTVEAFGQTLEFMVTVNGRWREEEIESIKFVSDYDTRGLQNNYRTFGLGVPLIAIRKPVGEGDPRERYYPPGLSLPLTAFFRVLPASHVAGTPQLVQHCELQLYDSLEQTEVVIHGRRAPLESDITTPLAYYLADPLLGTDVLATFALLDAEFVRDFRGLYMLEPFDPGKIPVVMVHGLWSSPVTWVEMFNDLRAMREIQENYQFWFYLYPTGQPFWLSAQQMRHDLQQVRRVVDPEHRSAALNQMVLVGHSMGGLVSRMQTIDSGDAFWRLVSDGSFEDLEGDPEDLAQLRDMLFFTASPSVQRVITLGTPHRGSRFANTATRWLSHKAFALPQLLVQRHRNLVRDNAQVISDPRLLEINTSIDSLAPGCPVFDVMHHAPRAPWVRYHNVVGNTTSRDFWTLIGTRLAGEGDGVVALTSARAEDVVSEIEVPADHNNIHRHPRSILEVRRILVEHLAEVRGQGLGDVVRTVRFDQRYLEPVPYRQQPLPAAVRPAAAPAAPAAAPPADPLPPRTAPLPTRADPGN